MSKYRENRHGNIDFWAVFQDLPEPYLLFAANDPEFTVIEVNKARERMTGVSRELSVVRPFFEVHAGIGSTYHGAGAHGREEYLRKLIKTGKAKRLGVFHYSVVQADGSVATRYWQPSYIPLRDASGKISHVLAATRDVTDGIAERQDLQAQVEVARQRDQLNSRESKILHERNQELETISRTKDEFVALASHQLRTPATTVKQYLGMVLQGYVGEVPEIQLEMLQKAFESNERQIQIINQILNAARVDTGRLVMTMMPADVCSIVQGVADDMRSSLEQRGHTFVVQMPAEPIVASADLGYLRMSIENLLHNASIYTPDGGRIELKITQLGSQVYISVADTGVGIRKADIGRLFTKFSRIHNPLSVQAGGSGIGLYLTAEIIRLHGGKVTVESRINHGTTFAILLPLGDNTPTAKRSDLAQAGRQTDE
jgi:signal transduction histidine kinase